MLQFPIAALAACLLISVALVAMAFSQKLRLAVSPRWHSGAPMSCRGLLYLAVVSLAFAAAGLFQNIAFLLAFVVLALLGSTFEKFDTTAERKRHRDPMMGPKDTRDK